MTKVKKWFEYNSVIIGMIITAIGVLFWVFNIYATGEKNATQIEKNRKHILQHCSELTNSKIAEARIESKLDILLYINEINPKKVKIEKGYLVTERGIEFDTINVDNYIKSLAFDND